MLLRRTHSEGIECLIRKGHSKWTISINYPKGQPPYAALIVRETTLDEAKSIADNQVLNSGHVCNAACKDWEVT